MIESLHIEDLGVIEEADLVLSPGLTALTGETGAGKTMVLTSLGLLLGQRAESTIVRAGAERALVEGVFTLDGASPASRRAAEAGAELEDDQLIVSRTVPASGRSRAHLGGRAVPSAVLSEVGAHLVAVHGQGDQFRLRSASAQRRALDGLGGREHAALCRRYAEAYRARRTAAEALEEWRAGARARRAEADRLRAWLAAVEQLDPAPGEDARLAGEAARLERAEDLRRAASAARAALAGDEEAVVSQAPDVLALVAAAERALAPVHDVDPVLSTLARRMRQLAIVSADIAAELGEYLDSLDADPERLARVQDRRAALTRVLREVGDGERIEDVDALLAFRTRIAGRLAELDGPRDASAALTGALAEADERLGRCAAELSAARRALGERLEEAVTGELEGLQMRGARLSVAFEPLAEAGPTGAEAVSLLLTAHPGAPALPLGKGVSGGELSRIMLALEVVLAEAGEHEAAGPRRTLVFDEIDSGVGGRAALEVGRRLARLARSTQVVVVTHLAQVAAWAAAQLVVLKERAPAGDGADGAGGPGLAGTTRTRVVAVEGADREKELARMLSGHEDSDAALRHAAELLEEAAMAQSQA
ncbi:DNA recombination protein RecN [Actinomyces sp. oral taxon 414]|uniref:DNA repair protein RecN n=1 Tax=Actinomyces sp. oral taxon 414 TaxID=712122 RepID=UPI0006AEE0C9|nr:DNA repair protein RecN [Actinomyces sp. oral taxon 414]ALC99416.1 DNA recombination protein RecN [Actinomyces sp. oral taxon 414]